MRHLAPVPGPVSRLPRLLGYLVKTVWQAVSLLLALPLLSHLDYLLVQTPPGQWDGKCELLSTSASKSCIRRFVITEKAPTRGRAVIRHYANQTARPL